MRVIRKGVDDVTITLYLGDETFEFDHVSETLNKAIKQYELISTHMKTTIPDRENGGRRELDIALRAIVKEIDAYTAPSQAEILIITGHIYSDEGNPQFADKIDWTPGVIAEYVKEELNPVIKFSSSQTGDKLISDITVKSYY